MYNTPDHQCQPYVHFISYTSKAVFFSSLIHHLLPHLQSSSKVLTTTVSSCLTQVSSKVHLTTIIISLDFNVILITNKDKKVCNRTRHHSVICQGHSQRPLCHNLDLTAILASSMKTSSIFQQHNLFL